MKQKCRCTKCRKSFEVEYTKDEGVWTVHLRVGAAHRKLSPKCAEKYSAVGVRVANSKGNADA